MKWLSLLLLTMQCLGQAGISGGASLTGGAKLSAAPAGASVTLTKIGQSNNISVTAATPSNRTATAGCAQNSVLVGAAQGDNGTADATFTFSDARANSWQGTQASWSSFNTSDGIHVKAGYALVSTAIQVGDNLTFTPGTGNSHETVTFYCITGNATSTPLDQVAVGGTSSDNTTQTSASITPTVQPTIAIALFGVYGAFSAAGNVFGSAPTSYENTAGGNSRYFVMEWREITAKTSGNATFTNATGQSAAVFLNLKEPGSS